VGWDLIERVLACERIRSIYLWGPPGTGKTFAALTKAEVSRGVYACTLTEDTPSTDLRGNWIPTKDGLVWQDGPATSAMRNGGLLVLNEPTRAAEETLSFLFGVIESPETARITLPNLETITPAPGFRCFLCDNRPPEELPEALQDRFAAELEVLEPHPEALARLSPDLQEAALRCFALDDERRVSLRAWLTIDEIRDEFGLRESCLISFGPERGSQIFDAMQLGSGGNG
jgi:MoxR-like ATPase